MRMMIEVRLVGADGTIRDGPWSGGGSQLDGGTIKVGLVERIELGPAEMIVLQDRAAVQAVDLIADVADLYSGITTELNF
jgi:hypothetical protein